MTGVRRILLPGCMYATMCQGTVYLGVHRAIRAMTATKRVRVYMSTAHVICYHVSGTVYLDVHRAIGAMIATKTVHVYSRDVCINAVNTACKLSCIRDCTLGYAPGYSAGDCYDNGTCV